MTLINYVLHAFFIVGLVAMFLKVYFHFNYFKICEKYPKDAKLIYFGVYSFEDAFLALLPFFWRFSPEKIPEEQVKKCRLLEKLINICLMLFYVGLFSQVVSIL